MILRRTTPTTPFRQWTSTCPLACDIFRPKPDDRHHTHSSRILVVRRSSLKYALWKTAWRWQHWGDGEVEFLGMSDLQKDAEYWHRTTLELIESIYQVKDKALGDPFGEHARWHEILPELSRIILTGRSA